MNKSLAIKNKFYLFFILVVSLFIFFYLFYFLINGERGVISYFKFKKLNYENKMVFERLSEKNDYLSNRISRLKNNSLDLDFLDEKIREKIGFIDDNELLIKFD